MPRIQLQLVGQMWRRKHSRRGMSRNVITVKRRAVWTRTALSTQTAQTASYQYKQSNPTCQRQKVHLQKKTPRTGRRTVLLVVTTLFLKKVKTHFFALLPVPGVFFICRGLGGDYSRSAKKHLFVLLPIPGVFFCRCALCLVTCRI